MPKKIDFTLTNDEYKQVETAVKKDKRREVQRRATAIRLLHLGKKPKEVAAICAVTEPSVYGWWRRWKEGGIEGLANQPHNPPKRKADEAYCRALDEALSKEPSEYRYDFAIWTRERLRDHLIRETGVELHVNWLGEVMKARGYEFRRPKHDMGHLQDQAEKEAAIVLLDELKKTSSLTILSSSLWTKRR
jgi:transposase